MDKTFGGNRGITPSISKGIKRQVIRYNRNDSFPKIVNTNKKVYGAYEDISRAKLRDLVHYLGHDWVDWECVDVPFASKEVYRTKASVNRDRTNSKVYRCTKCLKAYETKVIGGSGNLIPDRYLPETVFVNVPLDKKECVNCG